MPLLYNSSTFSFSTRFIVCDKSSLKHCLILSFSSMNNELIGQINSFYIAEKRHSWQEWLFFPFIRLRMILASIIISTHINTSISVVTIYPRKNFLYHKWCRSTQFTHCDPNHFKRWSEDWTSTQWTKHGMKFSFALFLVHSILQCLKPLILNFEISKPFSSKISSHRLLPLPDLFKNN